MIFKLCFFASHWCPLTSLCSPLIRGSKAAAKKDILGRYRICILRVFELGPWRSMQLVTSSSFPSLKGTNSQYECFARTANFGSTDGIRAYDWFPSFFYGLEPWRRYQSLCVVILQQGPLRLPNHNHRLHATNPQRR